jgi:hypothetical protein
VSLRAIARDMGMTAPGLYRCVCAGIFTELGQDIHQAIRPAVTPAEPTPDQVAVNPTVKMVAACREFRC